MKRLFYIIVIIGIPVIIFFQYQQWRKFSPPNEYDYQLSENIDNQYFDQEVVKTYYQNVQEIGSYARSMWFTHGIDVRNYDVYYDFLMAQTKQLEKTLEDSKNYKEKGYDNLQIRSIVEKGISLADYAKEEYMKSIVGAGFGDISQEVFDVQKQLTKLGYETPIDGNFRNSTLEILQKFQQDNDLAPTGIVDERTSKKLFGQ